MTKWTLWALLCLMVAGCGADDGRSGRAGPPVDADGDGVVAGPDCDDRDPAVHPGATERCNLVDDDCNGLIDDDPEDGEDYFFDADLDGYGTWGDTVRLCALREGVSTRNDDCEDTDPSVHPGAWDWSGDTVDANCSGPVHSADDDCEVAARFVGDVVIEREAEAAAMCQKYNGVVGNLQIRDSDLVDLSSLSCLCELDGDLVIENNPELVEVGDTSLRLLQVQSVVLRNNPVLASWSLDLGVRHGVELVANPALPLVCVAVNPAHPSLPGSIEVIGGGGPVPCDVEEIDGDLRSITSMGADFPYLSRVGGSVEVVATEQGLIRLADGVQIDGDLELVANPASPILVNPSAVGGSVRLADSPNLLLDLSALHTVGGDLDLQGLWELQTLYLGPAVVGGDLIVDGVGAVGGVGLDVGLASVAGSATWRDVTGCAGLDLGEVGGDLRLEQVSAPGEQCGPLASTVGGNLLIRDSELGELDAENLVSVGGLLQVQDNIGLTAVHLPLLESATHLDVRRNSDLGLVSSDGQVRAVISSGTVFEDNPVLGDIALTAVDLGSVELRDNAQLAALSGLSSLSSVMGVLEIDGNDALTSLAGLENLTEVGVFTVRNNPALQDLSAVWDLPVVWGDITITNNTALPSQHALDWVDSVQFHFGLWTTVENNGP